MIISLECSFWYFWRTKFRMNIPTKLSFYSNLSFKTNPREPKSLRFLTLRRACDTFFFSQEFRVLRELLLQEINMCLILHHFARPPLVNIQINGESSNLKMRLPTSGMSIVIFSGKVLNSSRFVVSGVLFPQLPA